MVPADNAGVARVPASASALRMRLMKDRMFFLLFYGGLLGSVALLWVNPYVGALLCWLTIGLAGVYVRRDNVRHRAADRTWERFRREPLVDDIASDPQRLHEVL